MLNSLGCLPHLVALVIMSVLASIPDTPYAYSRLPPAVSRTWQVLTCRASPPPFLEKLKQKHSDVRERCGEVVWVLLLAPWYCGILWVSGSRLFGQGLARIWALAWLAFGGVAPPLNSQILLCAGPGSCFKRHLLGYGFNCVHRLRSVQDFCFGSLP